MVLQLNAESTDTLQTCLATAQELANRLQIRVQFYFDRVAYDIQPRVDPPRPEPRP